MRQLGVIILGASTYDYWQSLSDPRFAASAKAFRRLFAHGGALGEAGAAAQVLDLYDSPASADDITSQIVEFVAESEFDDVILYYCGHGFISADRKGYCVTLRRTKELTKTSSSLLVRNLAHDLSEHLIGKRTFIVFDSCFSGDAVKEFMAPGFLDNFVEDYFMESFPRSGTAVIYATSGGDVALSKQQDTMTLFTGTLVSVLSSGLEAKKDAALISWRDAVEQVRKLTKERLGVAAPRPSITAVKSDDGDITTMPFFVNSAHAVTPPAAPAPVPAAPQPAPLSAAAPAQALVVVPPERRAGPRRVMLAAGIAAGLLALGSVFYVLDERQTQRMSELRQDIGGKAAPGSESAAVTQAAKDAAAAAAEATRQRTAEQEAQRQAAERQQAEQLAALRQQQADAEAARLRAEEADAARRKAVADAERARAERIAQADLCDQLAASPYDRSKAETAMGVSFQTLKLQASDAIAACAGAVNAFPAELRFKYQLARATQATDPRQALALETELTRANYPAAFDNFGWLTIQQQKDYPAAVAAFRRGAQLGDPAAMVSLAQMIEEKRFTPQTPQESKVELYRRAAAIGHQGAATAYLAALQEEQDKAAAAAAKAQQRAAAQQQQQQQRAAAQQPKPAAQQPPAPSAQEQAAAAAANAAAMGTMINVIGGIASSVRR
ncbi:caspase family protein [Azorhizobium doebereinerae]|uniref:caspase family protein n=1 Tax=Azorhizobium doebereinerae TaxID=281091 RepID=UPI0004154D38|nr:caspase family protein [Azorhizobium doebereinerae]